MYEYILREVTWVLHPRYTQEMLDLILNLGFSKCTSGSLPVADSCESLDSTTPSMGHAASDMAAPLRQLLWQLTPKSDRPYNDTDFNSIHRSGYEPNRFNIWRSVKTKHQGTRWFNQWIRNWFHCNFGTDLICPCTLRHTRRSPRDVPADHWISWKPLSDLI